MVSHRSLVNFTTAAIAEYGMTASDRVLQFASISFDAAAEEIYPCLCSGAALVLRTDAILGSASNLLRYCRDQQISVLDLPTAYWHQLTVEVVNFNESLPASLRLVIIGGEQALLERVVQWQNWVNTQVQHAGMLRSPRLVNTYGPTETTVVATLYEVPANVAAEESGVPIGRSLPNVQTYVLDRHLQPMPVGVPGELHIGGVGLARGYLNRPDLTARQFIPNPFSGEPGARLYKTGDLVKYRLDGQLEFLGRIDDQVKIRGFRIELGELEAVLTQHPQIREAVVTVQSDQSTEKRLLAYLVPDTQQTLTLSDLRRYLKERLPEYMVPSAFVVLDAIPLTPTGKVDRRILPTLNATHLTLESDFVEPRTSTEATLASFWVDLLKVDKLSIYNNFFELGGHSLLAAQLVARISQSFGVDLPLRSIFESATVAELAEHIETILWVRQASTLQTTQLDECEEGEL
jgi:acyl-coenzyme A synthetase/AMP-(fatty) acid ligase/acyl carrier protein